MVGVGVKQQSESKDMTYDHYRRSKPRLNVLRGWPGNETTSLTHSAKPKAGEDIKSGMVIVLDTNGEWVKATYALANNKLVCWATADQSDTDVVSSGRLLGLSVAGPYEIQTPYFDSTQVYADNTPLKVDTTAGQLTIASLTTADDEIVGMCTRGGKTDIAKINSEATPVAGAVNVISFITKWVPGRAS